MKDKKTPGYVYGPVPSWRLGLSLGVDIIPFKTCSFNCVYCEVGRTTSLTLERKEYVPKNQILEELRGFLRQKKQIDYITFSGSGEPTLNSKIGEMLEAVKHMTDIPVAVLTNSSLLSNKKIRQELLNADVILPSLDAVSDPIFKAINRPHPALRIEEIIEGLVKMREEFRNRIWLEVLLVKGVNDGWKEIRRLSKAIEKIRPDKVHLNTVVRPPAEKGFLPLGEGELSAIARELPGEVEIVRRFRKISGKEYRGKVGGNIKALLERRPCTLKDISTALNINSRVVARNLALLEKEAEIKAQVHNRKKYYMSTHSKKE